MKRAYKILIIKVTLRFMINSDSYRGLRDPSDNCKHFLNRWEKIKIIFYKFQITALVWDSETSKVYYLITPYLYTIL